MPKSFAFCLLLSSISAFAQAPASTENKIRAVMDAEAADWNKGDLHGFVATYSDNAVIVGSTVARGSAAVMQAYAKSFGTPEKMGKLSYTALEVHPLDDRHAWVLGHFHLERSAAGGGNADGIFTLLFEKTGGVWKIILDHTTQTSPR